MAVYAYSAPGHAPVVRTADASGNGMAAPTALPWKTVEVAFANGVIASVAPERNALLLFAGKSAHVGREVLPGQPKIVLRGDVYFDDLSPGDATAIPVPSSWMIHASRAEHDSVSSER